MKLLVVLALVGWAAANCPPFSEPREQSECLWMQDAEGKLSPGPLRQGFMDACGLSTNEPVPAPVLEHSFDWPDKCGHCSFKLTCQNRPLTPGCFPVKVQAEQCAAHSDVCAVPRDPMGKCNWGFMKGILGQCITNRPDFAGYKRQGYLDNADAFPSMNCKRNGDGCHCCCSPFEPKDGQCVETSDAKPTCEDYGEWNEWTDCLWHPMEGMLNTVKQHCSPKQKSGKESKWKIPPDLSKNIFGAGFEPPPRCGFCSAKIRCRTRPNTAKEPGCFPVDADKIACGEDDCEGCSEPCPMPHLPEPGQLENCDWQKFIMRKMLPLAETRMKKMNNFWRKEGIKKMAPALLPFGSCKDTGTACKCCCHPYEPNEDGSACVIKDSCKTAEDRGLELSVDTA